MRNDIMFIAHRAPWPPDRGDRIRSWHLLKALTRLAPVHVVALADSDADAAIARDGIAPIAASTTIITRGRAPLALAKALLTGAPLSVASFANARLAASVQALLAAHPIDAIVAFSGQAAHYVPADFAGRFIMDFVDVDSAKFASFGREGSALSPMRHIYAREGRALARFEAQVAQRADLSLFVSEAEAALFRARTGLSSDRVRALDNGIDLDRFSPAGDWQPLDALTSGDGTRATGPLAVFTGQMDYRPNVDAVAWFARDVMPALRARHPDARFAIVGRAPTAEVRALAALPGVIVTGAVPDTRPWLAAADVVVAPLTVARGVQNKLLEAMAMGRAVVASSAALEGLDVTVPDHALRADGVAQTIAALDQLFANPAAAAALGQAARARMVARYGWDATLAPLAAMLA
jgi:polysaccharide biosynthesis protein PslH